MSEPITRHTRFEDLPDFLTVEEARAYLALGKSTIYDRLRRGELHCVRFGRVIRVARRALQQYIDEQERPAGMPGVG